MALLTPSLLSRGCGFKVKLCNTEKAGCFVHSRPHSTPQRGDDKHQGLTLPMCPCLLKGLLSSFSRDGGPHQTLSPCRPRPGTFGYKSSHTSVEMVTVLLFASGCPTHPQHMSGCLECSSTTPPCGLFTWMQRSSS